MARLPGSSHGGPTHVPDRPVAGCFACKWVVYGAMRVLLVALQVRALEGEIRGVKQECDKLLSQQRHLQSKLHALEEDLGRIHSKVTPVSLR